MDQYRNREIDQLWADIDTLVAADFSADYYGIIVDQITLLSILSSCKQEENYRPNSLCYQYQTLNVFPYAGCAGKISTIVDGKSDDRT